ncbi:MAG: ribosome maturation factor RimP [Gammaproteobacteria bacterium]|nr:ribosome maturation factor RimP [Gammaproteobacteria bacterium]
MTRQLEEHLRRLLEPVAEALGYELVLLELVGAGRAATLRLYIDAERGVSADDCERVSREVAAMLDVEDPIPGAYRLEISSPGFDRPLVKPAHFQRFRGARVRVQTLQPLAGRRRFTGVLEDFHDGAVRLRDERDKIIELPLSGIERTRLIPAAGVGGRR